MLHVASIGDSFYDKAHNFLLADIRIFFRITFTQTFSCIYIFFINKKQEKYEY